MIYKYPVSRPHLGGHELLYVAECFKQNQLTHGPVVEQFEQKFAQALGAQYAVACSSGTAALHLALAALGIGPGMEVLVPDVSFVATANAVAYVGATPVLVDIDPVSWCMDVELAERAITPKTVAILPVHLYGNAANLMGLKRLAIKHGLQIIEDAAEGLGGKYENRHLGTHGICGCFSFYGNKVLTTGEGGMVITDDPRLVQNLKHYRGQGQTTRYMHTTVGFNYRMTSIAAAIGLAQLEALSDALAERRTIFGWYDKALADLALQSPQPGAAPWLYTVVLPDGVNRERIEEHLVDLGIETRPTFVPMHKLPMYRGVDEMFPHATKLGKQGLSLPTYVGLQQADVRYVAQAMQQVGVEV